jgi:hypothetical protein
MTFYPGLMPMLICYGPSAQSPQPMVWSGFRPEPETPGQPVPRMLTVSGYPSEPSNSKSLDYVA